MDPKDRRKLPMKIASKTQRKSEREEEIALDKHLWETKYIQLDTKGRAMHIQRETGVSKNWRGQCYDGESQE